MRNTIILAVILFVAVLAASIFYFRNLDQEHNMAAKPLRLLPDNTLLIVSMHNNEISDNIFKDFEVFDAMLGFEFAEQLSQLKKHTLRHESLAEFVTDTEVYFSFHPEGNRARMLMTIPVPTALTATDVERVRQGIEEHYQVSMIDTLGEKIYQLRNDTLGASWQALYHKNTIFVSESVALLSKILDNSTRHLPEEQIEFFLKNNSRNTPLSVYFPHQQLDSITRIYQRSSKGVFLDLFQKLYGQSAWNINFKQDALILTGESELDQYSENYISLFKNQEKTTQYLYSYFPANTAVYMEYSLSDRVRFQKDLRDLFKRRGEKAAVSDTSGVLQILGQAVGNEFGFIETSNRNHIGFIHLRDSVAWQNLERDHLEVVNDSVFRFRSSRVLYSFFGDAFESFTRPYVTVVDTILVVANSSQALRAYRDEWQERNLLIGTLGFKNFEKLQGNEANVTFFLHTNNANVKILNSLPTHYQRNFRDSERYGFRDFYSWSAQFSGNSGRLSSQLYAVYKSKHALGVTPEWVYEFTDRAITKPYVFEHSDTAKFILIQELDHTLHAIHPSGKQLWSAVFSGRVVGDMQQLPDRSIVLVTDRNRLYRFDTDGKPMPGFSLALPDEPIYTPTVASLAGREVIYVPTANQVFAYDFGGNIVDGWDSVELPTKIVGPVISLENQVAVGTEEGSLHFFDETGRQIKEVRLSQNKLHNPLGSDVDAGRGVRFLFATDTAGMFYRWSVAEGVSTQQPFDALSASSMVDFAPIRTPSTRDMVVMDLRQLRVFDTQNSLDLLFSYHFTKDILDRPQYFSSLTQRGQQLIGISSRSNRLIYLFEPNGTLMEGFPVVGQPSFYYGDINYNSGAYLLVMRSDHKLYAFKHQK